LKDQIPRFEPLDLIVRRGTHCLREYSLKQRPRCSLLCNKVNRESLNTFNTLGRESKQ